MLDLKEQYKKTIKSQLQKEFNFKNENEIPKLLKIVVSRGIGEATSNSKAVEVSPQRRVDLALRYITQGAYQKAFNSKKKIEQTLADEIIAASNTDQAHSNVIAKKLEAERQADASR